jgi:hypothetical protein
MPDPDDQPVPLPPLQPGWEAAVDSGVAAQAAAIMAADEPEPAPPYTATDLPSDPSTWPRWKKVATTPMLRMTGPFTVQTQKGPLACADGYLALDAEQQPYPVKVDSATDWPLNYEPADAEAADVAGPYEDGEVVSLGELTGGLCEAVGLDPMKVGGFRLTVQGGAFPMLEAYHLPPIGREGLVDRWAKPLAERLADTSTAILPGKGDIPPAQPRHDPLEGGLFAVPAELQPAAWLVRYLPMILDGLNGAPMDADTRDQLTAQGHHLVADLAEQVYGGRTYVGPMPPEYAPAEPDPDPEPYRERTP